MVQGTPGIQIPGTPIVIDCFGPGMVAKACKRKGVANNFLLFLCSHPHSDHTTGLSEHWDSGQIICSKMTCYSLMAIYGMPRERFRVLDLDEDHRISLNEHGSETMTLRLIDARNHCPGAVMFYMQGYFGKILYTGDIRYGKYRSANIYPYLMDVSALPQPYDEKQVNISRPAIVGQIDVAYIDNTTTNPALNHYVTVRETCDALYRLYNLVKPCTIVFESDNVGKETLFVLLARYLNTKIYVPEKRYKIMEALHETHESLLLPSEEEAFTADEREKNGLSVDWTNWFDYFTHDKAAWRKQGGCLRLVPKKGLNRDALIEMNRHSEVPVIGVYTSGLEAMEERLSGSSGFKGVNVCSVLQKFNTDADCFAEKRKLFAAVRTQDMLYGSDLCEDTKTENLTADNIDARLRVLLKKCGPQFGVPFSAHCSFTEISAFVHTLRPKRLEPVNVSEFVTSEWLHQLFGLPVSPFTDVEIPVSMNSVNETILSSNMSTVRAELRTMNARDISRALPLRANQRAVKVLHENQLFTSSIISTNINRRSNNSPSIRIEATALSPNGRCSTMSPAVPVLTTGAATTGQRVVRNVFDRKMSASRPAVSRDVEEGLHWAQEVKVKRRLPAFTFPSDKKTKKKKQLKPVVDSQSDGAIKFNSSLDEQTDERNTLSQLQHLSERRELENLVADDDHVYDVDDDDAEHSQPKIEEVFSMPPPPLENVDDDTPKKKRKKKKKKRKKVDLDDSQSSPLVPSASYQMGESEFVMLQLSPGRNSKLMVKSSDHNRPKKRKKRKIHKSKHPTRSDTKTERKKLLARQEMY